MCNVFCVYPLCLTHHQISAIKSTCKEGKKNKQWTNTTYQRRRQIIIIKAERDRKKRKRARTRAQDIHEIRLGLVYLTSAHAVKVIFSEPFLLERAQRGIYIHINVWVLFFSHILLFARSIAPSTEVGRFEWTLKWAKKSGRQKKKKLLVDAAQK